MTALLRIASRVGVALECSQCSGVIVHWFMVENFGCGYWCGASCTLHRDAEGVPEPVDAVPGRQQGHDGGRRAEHPIRMHGQLHDRPYVWVAECGAQCAEQRHRSGTTRGLDEVSKRENFQFPVVPCAWPQSSIAGRALRLFLRESSRRISTDGARATAARDLEGVKVLKNDLGQLYGDLERADDAAAGLVARTA